MLIETWKKQKSRRPTDTDRRFYTGAKMKQDHKNSENKEGDVFCSQIWVTSHMAAV